MLGLLLKLPNFLLFTLIFVTTFLLSFLLLSCYETADAYSGIYLTSFKFNKNETLIVTFNSTSTSSELTAFSIDVGYMNFCVNYDNNKTCTTFSNIDSLNYYPLIKVSSGNNDTTIDLVKLAESFNEICFSYVLTVSIILVLFSLVVMFWLLVPLLPWKLWARKIVCIITLINLFLWGAGAMLQHQATSAGKILIPASSMNLITVTVGKRADSVTWTAFTFLIVTFIGNCVMLVKEIKIKRSKDEPQDYEPKKF